MNSLLLFLLLLPNISLSLLIYPQTITSLNGTGFTRWLNTDDARCDSPRAAGATSPARTNTEILEASKFIITEDGQVLAMTAKCKLSVFPSSEGWILKQWNATWNEGSIAAEPQFMNITGIELSIDLPPEANLTTMRLTLACESTGIDTTFMVTCIGIEIILKSITKEKPAKKEQESQVTIDIILLSLVAVSTISMLVRCQFQRRHRIKYFQARELPTYRKPLFIDNVQLSAGGLSIVNHRNVIALKVDECKDLERFGRLLKIHHANLIDFIGLYGEEKIIYSLWIQYEERLESWLHVQTKNTELCQKIINSIASGLSALHDEVIVHGNMTIDNVVVTNRGEQFAIVATAHRMSATLTDDRKAFFVCCRDICSAKDDDTESIPTHANKDYWKIVATSENGEVPIQHIRDQLISWDHRMGLNKPKQHRLKNRLI